MYTQSPSDPAPVEPEPAYQPRPKPRRRRPAIQIAAFWIVAAAVVLAVAGGIFAALDGGKKSAHSASSATAPAISSNAPAGPTVAVSGTLVLGESQTSPQSWTSQTGTVGEACTAVGQWNNITSGTQVTVKDTTGAIVGATQLLAGRVAAAPSNGTVHPGQTCDFAFAFAAVPAGKNSYTFTVGTRGQVTIPESELATVALSID